jgi:ectoine hydroxylase
MQLSKDQAARFERDGYVFLPEVFGRDEVALLRAEADRIYASARPEVVREKDGATARTAFAVHRFSEPFRRLAAHPRLVRPVEQLLGGKCYIHQSRSTPRRRSTAMSGSGTRTTAPGRATT